VNSPAEGNAQKLFFNRPRFFIKSVWAMAASTAAAIAAFEMVFFCENLVALRREVIIFAEDQFIFLILFVHTRQADDNLLKFGWVKIK
jgi:hypothetical protein